MSRIHLYSALLLASLAPVAHAATALTSGVTDLVTVSPLASPVVITDQRTITVPAGTAFLTITTQSSGSGGPIGGVDLYIRKDVDVAYSGSSVLADFRLTGGPNPFRTITITNPAAGVYYIAFGINVTGQAINIAVTGTLSSTACSYSLIGNSTVNVAASGAPGAFLVTTDASCSWVPTTDVTWIELQTFSGLGPGQINFNVQGNPGVSRTGHITVGSATFTVLQAGSNTSVTDNTMIISQFAAGGGQWNSTLFLTNVSNVAESFTLRFYDDNGLACDIPFTNGTASVVTGALLPGETRRLETNSSGNLKVCWGAIVPGSVINRRLTGFAVFKQSSGGSSSEAVVGLTGARDYKQVLVFDNTNGLTTSMALVNTDPVLSAFITAQIYNETGQILGQESFQMTALGHFATELPKRFPVTAGRRGTIRFNGTPQGITGLGLRFSSNLNFTSFPLLTSPDIP